MVGTAYLSPEPGAANYVAEGASVKEGDTLLIVEAMKVMNPITAPRAGKVKAILVSNEQPVEYDQPLVIIE
jgi:acetyl-CoA carboxylase biotin carboxyl carrier protein